MLTIILLLVAGVALLYFGAEFLVRGGVSIATRLGVSPLIIGLTLVSAATSAPELVVSVQAAISGASDIAVGNIVGSNICNIALILGLSAAIAPLSVHLKVLRYDMPILLGVTGVFAAIGILAGGFGRISGAVLLAGLIAYLIWNIRMEKREAGNGESAGDGEPAKSYSTLISVLLVLFGLGGLVLGGKFMVSGAVDLGRMAGLSEAMIGLTIVAVGTSLPELATSVVAACRGQQDIAIGNAVGSNIFNILGIIGITALIRPVASTGITYVDWGALIFTAVILLPFMKTETKIVRWEGIVLLGIYAAYIVWLAMNA